MATVITLAGLGWQTTNIMDTLYNGFAHTGGNTSHPINYTPEFDGVYANGVALLNAAINDGGLADPKIVLAHSMGGQVAGRWLDQYGVSQAAKAATVSFILCGNPERRYGGRAGIPTWNCSGAINRHVRDDTAFTVTDVCRQGDGWGNWPAASNPFNTNGYDFGKVVTAFVGMFTTHMAYQTIDLTNLNGTHISSETVGNTTYHLMP